jgi:aldose 1-epimerase
MRIRPLLILAAALAAGCGSGESSNPVPQQQPQPLLTETPFGRTPAGDVVNGVTLRNRNGIEARIITVGGTIVSLRTPDRAGAIDDIVLGFDEVSPYLEKTNPYFGSIIGRYANRIANGRFAIDGKTHQLAKNDGENHLHGGTKGWDKMLWTSEPFQQSEGVGVILRYRSPAGDENYPGTVNATVTYTLNEQNQLIVDYHAVTDAPTIINLTQHSYFNLGGAKTTDILGHELMLSADQYTPVNATLIPTGELATVEGTPFDFRTPTAIGARIGDKNEQLTRGRGYDHNFVVRRTGPGLELAARVVDKTTGRSLEIATTEPGIQFYSGNFLDGSLKGKGGRVYPHRSGFCLEPQHYPDSPNQKSFPPTVLRPGEEYRSQTVFTFGIVK